MLPFSSRDTLYDDDNDRIEEPRDDGARHRLWVSHEARHRDPLHRTSVGARLDLGRLMNYVADFIDYRCGRVCAGGGRG